MIEPDFDSCCEKKLWDSMKAIGLSPIHHYNFDLMEVDFAFPEQRIIVEVDGIYHQKKKQKFKDIRRNYFVRSNNWRVLRFKAEKVYKYSDYIAKIVKWELDKPRKINYKRHRLFYFINRLFK